ncbi:hypothetical protein CONCODRAFT_12906 [Conidiobolus coronatus NRRL 28638]|uniref:Uncharacterized protein n=1 Tax=Conidiobolus coronatus (strain ATCC 28846 / CBS 209.66 / NRRL 28638) TaxID=796925 RepID=A0A137NRV2_CONC2|nr:hypothetical protein CONCODRAFT_12906 [Conidiobolus coronatus NRRL 28638]|eukprot:KXN65493.1 hypothetical protein CONCODRAFT_12906 [Conidiobolus coronatus NRRL 28638]
MEENNNKQIKWEVILTIPEFANLLNISTLKELSLLSKLFRLKSLSKLFKIIQLDEKVFPLFLNSSKNNLICEYFGSRNCAVRYGEDGGMDKNFSSEENTDMGAESTVKEIELKLEKHKHHVKSFKLAYLKSTGYYLLPISNIFLNLTSLKIVYSVVSFKIFSELLSNLTKLNFLELNNASLAVLPTQEQTFKF